MCLSHCFPFLISLTVMRVFIIHVQVVREISQKELDQQQWLIISRRPSRAIIYHPSIYFIPPEHLPPRAVHLNNLLRVPRSLSPCLYICVCSLTQMHRVAGAFSGHWSDQKREKMQRARKNRSSSWRRAKFSAAL